MTRSEPRVYSTAAALLALLMLSFASVQSLVMEATTMPSGAISPICGEGVPGDALSGTMADINMQWAVKASTPKHHQGVPLQHQALCPYCAAAGHAPVLAQAVPLCLPTQCVFAAFRSTTSFGRRDPPAQQPRARSPPADPLTA